MSKIINDKYYTPPELAKYIIGKTKEVVGKENISEYLEPSAGSGIFLDYLPENSLAYDIEPENNNVIKQDFLSLDLEYKKGRCIIGNPPYGRCLSLAQKFYKKSILMADYIVFILPISQLNNTQSMYEFDLIYSEDLGYKTYTDRTLHCCLNIYKRPENGLNKKQQTKLEDITFYRQDSKNYKEKDFDIRMCYWGDGSAGKILKDNENYSAEYKIKVHNNKLKDKIIYILKTFDWKGYLNCIAMKKIQQFHIINILKEKIPEIK